MTLAETLREMSTKVQGSEIGPEIQSYMHSRIVSQFSKLRKGGSDRGVSWSYFKNPWYTRKDGTQVPIWGGVPRADGKGKVKGKKRSKTPEGKKRYTPNSAMMQSTGILKGALLSSFSIKMSRIILQTPVAYAGYQEALREWNFISDEEADVIGGMIARRLR